LKLLNDTQDLIQIGKITGVHGIRGAVKVHSFSDSGDCYNQFSDLIIVSADGRRLDHRVEWSKPHKSGLRLGIKEIATRNQAEALVGCGIFIARTSLPPLDEDTNYWVDLIGMAVYNTHNEHIGRIVDIIPTGANDVYVVKTRQGHAADEILLPAIASVVLEVDVPGKRMRVDVPDGLI
jgi:16S rRNA processing protein RimM